MGIAAEIAEEAEDADKHEIGVSVGQRVWLTRWVKGPMFTPSGSPRVRRLPRFPVKARCPPGGRAGRIFSCHSRPTHYVSHASRFTLKPFRNLAQTHTPDGSRFSLHEHDGEYFMKLNGRQLMSTTSTTSELLLAQLPCEGLSRKANASVLIGGLGLGYSLRRVLELAGPDATIHVAELLPEVVEWNREFLRDVNGKLLDDPRVKVLVRDVFEVIRQAPKPSYDAILLDVDNGPTSFVQARNSRIYKRSGFDLIARALRPGGKVAFWSACEEPGFMQSLARAGFKTEAFPAKAHERAKRFAHVIYVAGLS